MPRRRDPITELGSLFRGASRGTGAFSALLDGWLEAVLATGRVHASTATEIVEQIREWGIYLTQHALQKWPIAVARGEICAVPHVGRQGLLGPCDGAAVVQCDCCGRPCCLAHCRIDYTASAICGVCVAGARAAARGRPAPRPAPADSGASVAAALRTLKLRQGATFDEVKRRYKALVVKHNADAPQSEASRKKNTERLQRLNAAYELLRGHFEKEKAA